MSIASHSKRGALKKGAYKEERPMRFESEPGGPGGARKLPARIWWLLALAVAGATLLSVFRQPLRDDPFEPVGFSSFNWWFYPIERNAHRRLDAITADLYSVFAVDGTNTLWVSGTGGMIAESADGGRSWARRDSVDNPTRTRVSLESAPPQRVVSSRNQASLNSINLGSDAEALESGVGAEVQLRTLGLTTETGLMEPTIREAALSDEGKGRVEKNTAQTRGKEPEKTAGAAIGSIAGGILGGKSRDKAPGRRTPPLRSTPASGSISGFVRGTTGEALSGAEVVARAPSGSRRRILTKPDGSFRIDQLPIDTRVEIAVRRVGYHAHTESVVVSRGSTLVRDFILSPASEPSSPPDEGLFLPAFPTEDIVSISFTDRQTGWAVTKSGIRLATTDGGSTWRVRKVNSFFNISTERLSGADNGIRSAQFADKGDLRWVLFKTQDGMAVAIRNSSGSVVIRVSPAAVSVFFSGEERGWITGDGGVSHTTDGGRSWSSFAGPPIIAAHFIDSTVGWAVGDHGTVVKTTDGGASWQSQPSGTASRLNAVYFLKDGRQGWVAGGDGTILATTNGGRRWIHLTQGSEGRILSESGQPSHWPPPITVLGILLSLALGVQAVRTAKAPPAESESGVADLLVSDRPLELGEPDALDLNSIATGLSRFLRNERTLPPLTIAITGEWGTGKSSLMNLLRSDLRGHGFRPVWFNAWHHQKEEHLLASLLQCIRLEAVPHWWKPEGMMFRLRLLAIRSRRHWVPLLLLLSAFSAFAGYELNNSHVFNLDGLVESLANFNVNQLFERLKALAADGGTLGFLITLAGVVRSLWKGTTAFGVNPASLISSMSSGARLRNLDAQISFRQRFSREFRDVTSALGPRSMLILIDDLDRCRPDQVLEVLEAVNFLVSSGECFVVMGMARGRVEGCVGLSFRDVAAELHDGGTAVVTDYRAVAKATRRAFARQYLDKLINIEVPVPIPSPEQSRMLLRVKGREDRRSATSDFGAGLRQWIEPFLGPLAAMILCAITIAASYQLGRDLADRATGSEVLSVVRDNSGTAGPVTSGAEELPLQADNGDAEASKTPLRPRADATSRTKPQPSSMGVAAEKKSDETIPIAPPEIKSASASIQEVLGYSVIPPIALASLALFTLMALFRRPDSIVVDSPEFERALEIWHPVVAATDNTPRGIKRFINRVRYLAMRQQIQKPPVPLSARIRRNLGLAEPETTKPPEPAADYIPESILVALTAIHTHNPSWLQTDSLFIEGPDPAWRGISDCPPLSEAMKSHEQAFHNWKLMARHRGLFRVAASGVRVN